MQILSKILRGVSLAFLSGGSTATVIAAVVLVKTATAKGIPVAEAAAANAPVFIAYSKVALVCAGLLAVGEIIDFLKNSNKGKLDYFRYASSLFCIAGVAVFGLGITPQLGALLPDIASNPDAHEKFHKLHELSRAVFGASILGAFISLLLPLFKKDSSVVLPNSSQSLETKTANIN